MLTIELIRHVKVDGRAALYGKTDVQPLPQQNHLLVNALLARASKARLPFYHQVLSSPLQRCAIAAEKFASFTSTEFSIVSDLQEMNFGRYDGVPFDNIPFDGTSFDSTTFDNSCSDNKLVISKQAVDLEKFSEQTSMNTQLHWSELHEFFKQPASIKLPQAESLEAFNTRVIAAWQHLITEQLSLAKLESASEPSKEKNIDVLPRRVVVFAHGGVIRVILAHILQLNWQQGSWYQNLHIGYGSLTQVVVTPMATEPSTIQLENISYFQQVTTIAMPIISETTDQ